MGRFINPFTDYGFKKIFGQEVTKELLIDFLNDLLAGERVIRDLTFLDKEMLPEISEGRGAIYDVYCTTDTGEHIIVEMQNRAQLNFKKRALFYVSRAIVNQAVQGEAWKYDVKAVYGVFFMNHRLHEGIDLRTDVILANRETGELFCDAFRQIFISLPLFNKQEYECETDFERWIYVLKNMSTLDRMPFEARKAVFKRLEKIADKAALSPLEQAQYDRSKKAYTDNIVTLEAAREEGREEAKLETARSLKALGIAPELIAQSTGIAIDRIKAL